MNEYKKKICIDFDGVIHDYKQGWQNGVIYGEITPGFFDWALAAYKYGFELVVYSSRSKDKHGIEAMTEWLLQKWYKIFPNTNSSLNTLNNDGPKLSFNNDLLTPPILELVFSSVKPPAWLTIDDRAICFKGNWQDFALTPQAINKFTPWTVATEKLTIELPSQNTVWRHYKGNLYKIIGHGVIEATMEPAIIYQDANNELSQYFIRSVNNWFETVGLIPRFEHIQI